MLSFNLLFLSTYVLGALGVYLLVLRLTGDWKAGIVAGVIFVFSPLRNEYLQFTNISTIQWIPFLALWFIKMVDEPTVRKGLVTAVFFLLVVLSSGYFAISSIFMLGVIFLWNIRKTLNQDFAKALSIFLVTSPMLVLPFVYPALKESLSDYSGLKNSYFTPGFSADVFSFVTPTLGNPLYTEYVRHIYGLFRTHFIEWDSYLGIVTIGLMLLGVFKFGIRKTGLWVLMFLLFVIISLGPHLQILGKQFDDTRLPFYFLQELPVIESMRSPKRFLVTAMLAAAVIAGFGAHYIFTRKIFARKIIGQWSGLALMIVLAGLIITDYWGWPRNLVTSDASYPIFLENIAREEGDFVTLSIPVADSQAMYYQTIHGKKMIGGYVERPLPAAMQQLQQNKFLESINLWTHSEEKREITPEEEQDALNLFSQYPEIKYVIYMKRLFFYPDMRLFAVYRPWLESRFGAPVFEDDLVAVYRVTTPSGK